MRLRRLSSRTACISLALLNYWFAWMQTNVDCSSCGRVLAMGCMVGSVTLFLGILQWRTLWLCHGMIIASLSGFLLNLLMAH